MQLIRGRVVSFDADPLAGTVPPLDIEDGAVLVEDGRIAAVGEWADLARPGVPVADHRGRIILPGFIDPHIHFPQLQVVASWGTELLDWLNRYTFPAEARFADRAHAKAMSPRFLDALIRAGTTTACCYCSSHRVSAEALLSEAERRGMALIAGKVMMDRNAPEAVRDTAQSAHDDTEALIRDWHGRGRLQVAITPRFAITSTPAQLEAAGALAAAHPEVLVQTHISENHAEIALTAELFPEARDYLDVYDRAGLLSDRLLLGHCLHLTPREIARMAEAQARAVACPTSNLFLGSGLFDHAGLRAGGIPTALATDIGGGTSWSMLQTLGEAYKVAAMRGERLHAFDAFHWATAGNAEALHLGHRLGRIAPGYDADLIALDPRATPEMALRMEAVETLSEALFLLQVMGDDRAVAQTWIAGRAAKA
ncbi:guanine deaminase [Paracoccus sp. S-4012]|uniref:guanine deaminase n=1 Tax=Paracoccus sp. S-4012 TaxID=2665648 RepID=UPI0012B08350|nr:guanine deaminase [Paracoccus sp. S-4012]MRX49434.1 guanine deaminase [Paracoccus sp. S-4012]